MTASAIGPEFRVVRGRSDPADRALLPPAPAHRAREARRRGAAAPAGAAGDRGCACGPRFPARGSSPCSDAPPSAARAARSGCVRWSVSKPSRGRRAATRAASKAAWPTSGTPSAATTVIDAPLGAPADRRPRACDARSDPSSARAASPASPTAVSTARAIARHLDPEHEAHPLQVVDERRSRARLDVDPGRLAVVDERQVMLDVAVGREDQRLDADAGREIGQVLAGQRVQPAEPVGPGDGDDLAVRPVDESRRERLLAQRIAVVRRDALIRRISGDGAGTSQQHAGLASRRSGHR